MAFQPIRTQESGHVIKANNILCILTYFSTRNLCKAIIKRPTSKGVLCLVSTLISGWISAFRRPYGPCPQADTRPDTWIDTRPCTPFSVGPQLPKCCGCIGFLSPIHKKIPDSYSKREGGNPGNSGFSSQ